MRKRDSLPASDCSGNPFALAKDWSVKRGRLISFFIFAKLLRGGKV
ncbi:hypothetical protein LEP1GSC017_3174 [Leptospira meyeri serovar Hardjo str. Went 5]|nr:hypothetical protein LEP1GSC017_3174 [Leptospira meyeri serovar Hardjo str. Went 5]